ncbi:MAG: nucleotidyltransferase [Peptostreptococcaceae bacterium]
MKTVGLIVEYNPFHNGHKYHLDKSLEITNATHSIAVMSGNFLQRGEPALFDKFTRANVAVKNGVDLVVELPILFSTQSAELFSFGAINLLNSLNIVDDVCFGSEEGNIEILKEISKILNFEPLEFKENLKKYIDEGNLFASARSNALFDYIKNNFLNNNGLKNVFVNYNKEKLFNILNSSNNILGIEYIKALLKLNSSINPKTITRISNSYNSETIDSTICSATAIRKNLKENNNLDFLEFVTPKFTNEMIKEKIDNNFNPLFDSDYYEILSSIIYRDFDNLNKIFEVNEGIENKIYSNVFKHNDFNSYLLSIKSKRYTLTKIKRILNNILLGITKEDIKKIKNINSIPYVRVLAFNDRGREIIKKIKENSQINIITKFSNTEYLTDDISKTLLKYDVLATNIYNNLYYKNNRHLLKGAMDYYISPKYIK